MALATTVSRSVGLHVGDDTQAFRDYQKGDVLELTGADTATVTMPDIRPGYNGNGSGAVGKLVLNSTTGSGANTFALPAGVHGQEILVVLGTKTGGNVVLAPDSGVTIVTAVATAVATITMTAAAKFALLRYVYNGWQLIKTDATVA